MAKSKEDRNKASRNTLDSLKCTHKPSVLSVDKESGDIFCGDCGDVVTPWAEQTTKQQSTYRWAWGKNPG